MGMSADYETAVRLGATHVRVGSALFGSAARRALEHMPELPEVETVRRGLVPRHGRPAHRSPDPAPQGPSRAAAGQASRRGSKAARVLAHRPPGKISAAPPRRRPDPDRPSRHVGPHDLARCGERRRASVRAARPCRVRYGRWLAGSFQRRTPLRPDAAGADEAVAQAQGVQGAGARAARRRFRRRRPGGATEGTDAHPSRRHCSIRRPWSASATSMPARRCSCPASRRAVRPTPCRAIAPSAWSQRSSRCCCARSTMAARPCAIMSSRAASSAISRRASMSTIAPARRARRADCGHARQAPGAVRPLDLLLRALPALASKSKRHRRNAWPPTKTSRPRPRAGSASSA